MEAALARAADFREANCEETFFGGTEPIRSLPHRKQVQDWLRGKDIKFECTVKKNDFGQVTQALLLVSGPFPSLAVLHGDYDEGAIAIELSNVKRAGNLTLRVPVDELSDDLLDEFGTWLLGADDAFERFLKRA